jgi:predicted nucleic acid-binding protein
MRFAHWSFALRYTSIVRRKDLHRATPEAASSGSRNDQESTKRPIFVREFSSAQDVRRAHPVLDRTLDIIAGPKRGETFVDVLLALTARSAGARLVTSDRADFELIASYHRMQLEIW